MNIYKQMFGGTSIQFACDFTMAKTRHILFLVTTIFAYIGSSNGGYYSGQSNAHNSLNQNNENAFSSIGHIASSNGNQQSDSLTTQSLDGKLNNEDADISTRYELDQTVPQNINEEQYRSAVNQLESEVHKPENYYSNQQQALPNTVQSENTPSSVITQTNPETANLLPNQHNSVQSANSNQIILQSESIRTNLRSFYPSLYTNYANSAAVSAQPGVYSLPLSTAHPQNDGHHIHINHVQNVPHANVETVPYQPNNLLSLPLSAPSTLEQTPVAANVQNIIPHANVGIVPTQSAHSFPLNPAQPLVEGNQIPVNYNVHHVLPQANLGIIPAQPSPGLSVSLSSQVLVGDGHIPINSGVHVLPQENVGILPAQPNLLPLQAGQQVLANEQQIPINYNVQNLAPIVNVPTGGQYVLNGANGYSNIGSQSALPVNFQQAPIAPIVTKDIYFHAAPSDFDDAPAPTPAPKKTYKIIFIKLPSQESKNTALLQSLYNQYAAREDKTLIYVLVKKPEEQQALLPQPKAPSEHEVIFVKYKNVKENSATVDANEAEPKHDDSSLLKPGLINGH